MGYDAGGPKRDLNIRIDDDLLRRVIGLTPDLSETIEALLADYVSRSEAEAARRDQQIAAYISDSDRCAAEHGSLSDEFSTL